MIDFGSIKRIHGRLTAPETISLGDNVLKNELKQRKKGIFVWNDHPGWLVLKTLSPRHPGCVSVTWRQWNMIPATNDHPHTACIQCHHVLAWRSLMFFPPLARHPPWWLDVWHPRLSGPLGAPCENIDTRGNTSALYPSFVSTSWEENGWKMHNISLVWCCSSFYTFCFCLFKVAVHVRHVGCHSLWIYCLL